MRRHALLGPRRIAAVLGAAALLVACLAQAQSVWPDVGGPLDGARADGQRDAAVLIGIEDYAFVPDVSGASANINDWYSYLRKVRGVPLANIRLLRDTQATREEILASVDVAAARAGAGGNLWIVFIGHGAAAASGAEGLLVGADAQQSANSLTSRGVPQSELFAHARKGKQARIVAVLDACFSGRDTVGGALVPGLQPLVAVKEQPTTDALVFTAAANDQFAGPLPGAARPAFSYLMLGALRGWADGDGNGDVTATEALTYTSDVLDALVNGRRQQPQLHAARPAEVLAARASESGPDLDGLRLELGVGTAATPVERPDDGAGSGQQVRIEASEPDQSFEATIVAFDGSTRRCPNAVTIEQPCVLRNLPPGSARLKVTGDSEVSEKVEVSSGITRVQLYDHPGWGYSVGGVMSGVGMIGYFGGFFGLVSCSDDPSCSNALWITTLAGGAVTMLTGFGLLGWAFWKDYAHDFGEHEVESFPLAGRPSREAGGWAWQLAPWVTPDSAGLGLGVTLP